MSISKSTKTIRYISIALFAISLACPCFDTEKEIATVAQGGSLLLMGTFFFMFLSPGFVWLANPLLVISWLSINKKPGRSFITALIAIIIAMCFLFYNEFLVNEGGGTTPITAHKIGYWLWLASIFTMILGNLYLQLFSSQKTESQLTEISN